MTQVSSRKGLHRLVYFSRFGALFPTAEPDQDDAIRSIVSVSIRNNRQRHITGLLLSHQHWFIQALEGPAEAVMTTYGRILSDPRHRAAQILGAGPAPAREFANWNMCARRLSTVDDAILATLAHKGTFDPTALSLGAALNLLKAVRGVQSRAMAVTDA